MAIKNLSLLAVCSATIAISSANAAGMPIYTLADLDKSSSSNICQDPLRTICKDTEALRVERDERVAVLKSEISREAAVNAAPRIAAVKKKYPAIRFVKRWLEITKVQNQEIMKSAEKRVSNIEAGTVNEQNIQMIKGYMNQAIDSTNYSLTTKNNLKGVIASTIIGNFADFLERTNLDDNVLAQLVSNPCGSDGLVTNAFATTIGNQRYVLMCPGFLVSLSQAPSESERFNSIVQALSHEIGHQIDGSKVGMELYGPYLNCLSDNYSDQFNRTKEDKKFCGKNDAKACNDKVTESHAGELVADAWGIKALALHMKAMSLNFEQADNLLTQSWYNLCDSGDEGIHPTGDFRIGTLMRTNPEIANYLACDNSQINMKPACTLEGAVNL